ncbi:hypothetical protein H5410_011279 [Solanum commersonii]|uniref:Uncharacterized protein n=1 Tax=Solanum commersonii TaxID=4109 RepID=A0A9J6AN58_SOLCO|nr:hypothetical protein H5410_011279 [Solanum commersonii]
MARVVLYRFSGTDSLADRISRAERYFTLLGFSEEHWLPLPSLYLDGEALKWFRWMFRNKQFFDWTHFKEKLALRFPKRTYAKSPVVDAQISNILTLLQKIENKYSVTSKQVIVEDVSISVATVFSGEIDFPLVEENSSHVDNIEGLPNTFINDLLGHVDNKLDEMSTGVFTKEIEETSSASSCVAVWTIVSQVFNECFPSCCPLLVAEVQSDTANKMLAEEASGPKHSVTQLIDECSPKDMSKRYVAATFLVHLYLTEFFLEPATIEDLYYEKQILEIEDCIPQSTIPSDELMIIVEHGKFTCELNTHNILCQFSFNRDDIFLVLGAATNLCVWDPGISFNSKALIGYTVNTKPLLLLGSIGTVGFIAYSNSMTQVWDPGQQRYEW